MLLADHAKQMLRANCDVSIFSQYGGAGQSVRNENLWQQNLNFFAVPAWREADVWNGNLFSGSGRCFSGCMLTPRHVYNAFHVGYRQKGERIVTTNRFGTPSEARVLNWVTYPEIDVCVSLLDRDVPVFPPSIGPPDLHEYLPAYVSDESERIKNGFPLVVVNKRKEAIAMRFDWMLPSVGDKPFLGVAQYTSGQHAPVSRPIEPGDSGSPIFLAINRKLILLATFWTAAGGVALHSIVPEINNAIDILGRYGHSLDVVDFTGMQKAPTVARSMRSGFQPSVAPTLDLTPLTTFERPWQSQ